MTMQIGHKEALARLSSETRASLQTRSDIAGLRHLMLYLAVLATFIAYVAFQGPFWPIAMLPLGVLWVFLFTLSHECTHMTPFATPVLNRSVGHACALPLLLPFNWFRAFHMAHHKYTNDPLNDPELEHGHRPTSRMEYLTYLSGWGYWRGMARTLWHNAFLKIDAPYLPPRLHNAMRYEARFLLTAYALVLLSLTQSLLALWIWIIPVFLGQPFLRAYLLTEHGHCPPVANMLENSRTTFTNRLVRCIAWNMPYHAEHHSFPNVPFHRLPDLHAHLRPHLQSTSPGYHAFHRHYAKSLK